MRAGRRFRFLRAMSAGQFAAGVRAERPRSVARARRGLSVRIGLGPVDVASSVGLVTGCQPGMRGERSGAA